MSEMSVYGVLEKRTVFWREIGWFTGAPHYTKPSHWFSCSLFSTPTEIHLVELCSYLSEKKCHVVWISSVYILYFVCIYEYYHWTRKTIKFLPRIIYLENFLSSESIPTMHVCVVHCSFVRWSCVPSWLLEWSGRFTLGF